MKDLAVEVLMLCERFTLDSGKSEESVVSEAGEPGNWKVVAWVER